MSGIQEALGLRLGGLTLVRDGLDAPGSFVLLQLLRAALREGHQVVLLLAREPLPHYQYVLRKLGVSLADAVARGQAAVTDLVTAPELALNGTLPELAAHLDARVQQSCDAAGASGGVALFVDSLTELHSLFCDCERGDWLRFLLRLVACERQAQHLLQGRPFSLVTLVHEDVEEDASWTAFLEHQADDAVRVEALEAGPAQEVTGRLHVAHRRPRLPPAATGGQDGAAAASPRASCLYKLTEAAVRVVQTEQNVL